MKFTSLFFTATALFGLASARPSPAKRELEAAAAAADLADPMANFDFSYIESAIDIAFSQIEQIPTPFSRAATTRRPRG